MRRLSWLLALPLLAVVVTAHAQDNAPAEAQEDKASQAQGHTTVQAQETFTEAEIAVQEIIAKDGLHLVHLWAPWCDNSNRELSKDWAALAEKYPDVTFTFVTVWNRGRSGAATLRAYNIPDRVSEITAQDSDDVGRLDDFLGLPVDWIPATWIFRDNGELAFALNYGEMDLETIDQLLSVTHREW